MRSKTSVSVQIVVLRIINYRLNTWHLKRDPCSSEDSYNTEAKNMSNECPHEASTSRSVHHPPCLGYRRAEPHDFHQSVPGADPLPPRHETSIVGRPSGNPPLRLVSRHSGMTTRKQNIRFDPLCRFQFRLGRPSGRALAAIQI